MKTSTTINKLLFLFFSYIAVSRSEDCTEFVDELSTFCRYDKNTGINRLRKIKFLTDKKTLKNNCDIFKDIPNTVIEECEEEEEENKNIKMIDFFPEKTDDYNIFNIRSQLKDGTACDDCTKWILNKDTIDIFPEQSKNSKSFSSFLEMEIQTFENLEKKSYLLINFAYSNEKINNGLRIFVNGATKLDLTNSTVSSDKTIGYKLKLKPNKSYLVQLEYIYQLGDKKNLMAIKRQMIDDDADDTPTDKSFAQIKLLYLKRGDFLKFTGKVKGEPDLDDDDDDDEKPTEGANDDKDNKDEKPTEGANDDKDDEDEKPTEGANDEKDNKDEKPTKGVNDDKDNKDEKPTKGVNDDKDNKDEKPTEGTSDSKNGEGEKPTGDLDGDKNEEKPTKGSDGDKNDKGEKPTEGFDDENDKDEKSTEGLDEDKDEKSTEGLDDDKNDNDEKTTESPTDDGNDDPLDYPNYGNNDDQNGNDYDNNDNSNGGNGDFYDDGDNQKDNNDNNSKSNEKIEEGGSGFGRKVLLIGGIGLIASVFYCRSSASSKAKRQYALTQDNLELDDLEKGIVDIEKELEYDEDDNAGTSNFNSNSRTNDHSPDEEAFFEEMSDDDEGYETYGFTKF